MTKQHGLDVGFLQRLVRTTLVVGGLVTLVLCATANGKWVVNYALGVLISLGFLKVTELFVTQTYRAPQEAPPKRRWAGALMVGKYGILLAGLYLLARLRYLDGVLLTAGVATLHAVLVLKVFGLMLTGFKRQATQ
ncbi:MAG: hypothetical protein PVTTEEND_002172 [Candidatus Fervidibacter sp.]|jgi:ATP synthase I chain.